jgi:hypothetical protein
MISGVDEMISHLASLLDRFQIGAIDFLLAIAVALVGWLLSLILARLAFWILRALRFDDAMERMLGHRAMVGHEPARVASWALFWIGIGITILLALDVLGFDVASPLTDLMRDVVPRVVAAAILFALGWLVAQIMGGLTRRFFETAGFRRARLRGQVVSLVLTIFAVLVALEQLGFAAQFVMGTGLVVFGGLALALGLAFGLGCRELARDFVVEYLRSLEEGPEREQP